MSGPFRSGDPGRNLKNSRIREVTGAMSSFELKSNQYVLTLVCSPDAPFEKLLTDVRDKFRRSAKFFRGGQMAVRFQGRELTDDEQRQVISAITESCQLDITCIIEAHSEDEEKEAQLIAKSINDTADNTAVLVPHSLRNGQRLSFGRTVVILGDVQPGAEVVSDGSIVVMGIAMGILRAGSSGDMRTFVYGTVLKPLEIAVAGHRAVSGIRKNTIDHDYAPDPRIACLKDGHISLEPAAGNIFEAVLKGGKLPGAGKSGTQDPSAEN